MASHCSNEVDLLVVFQESWTSPPYRIRLAPAFDITPTTRPFPIGIAACLLVPCVLLPSAPKCNLSLHVTSDWVLLPLDAHGVGSAGTALQGALSDPEG